MAYKLIDEAINLWSCSIADLAAEEVAACLKQWEQGAKIGSLTAFYMPGKDMVVINRDHADYDSLVMLCEKWLNATQEVRDRRRPEFQTQMVKDVVKMLDGAIERRENQKFFKIIDNQPLVPEEYDLTCSILSEVVRKYESSAFMVARTMFLYGIMQGERIERARKKAGAA